MKKKNQPLPPASQESEALTSDLKEPDLELFDIASSKNSKREFLKNTGLPPSIGMTLPTSAAMSKISNVELPATLTVRSGKEGGGKGPLISENISLTLTHLNNQSLFDRISSGEAPPVRISQSPASEGDSLERDQDFSISGKISLRRTNQDTLLSWSRSQDSSLQTKDSILPPLLAPSADGNLLSLERGGAILAFAADRSGRCVGGLLTLDTLEWPKEGVECFLPQILEKSIPPKYYGSQKYCLGILRRSARRGITFAGRLRAALAIRAATPLANNLWLELLRRPGPGPQELLDKAMKLIYAFWPLRSEGEVRNLTQEVIQAWGLSVRRLTPTETLTLQGFPKDWCDLPIQKSITRQGMRSASKSRSGLGEDVSRRLKGEYR